MWRGVLWGHEAIGIGDGALWGHEVSGNGEWGSMGFQNQWEWCVGFYGVLKSLGLEMGFMGSRSQWEWGVGVYGVMKSLGMGCGALWGHKVSGNGVWGSMGF